MASHHASMTEQIDVVVAEPRKEGEHAVKCHATWYTNLVLLRPVPPILRGAAAPAVIGIAGAVVASLRHCHQARDVVNQVAALFHYQDGTVLKAIAPAQAVLLPAVADTSIPELCITFLYFQMQKVRRDKLVREDFV